MPHILVVEDDVDIRSSIAEILRDEGYDVGECENGQIVLEMLRAPLREQLLPCLLLVDLLMPGISGEQLASELRADAELAAIPVVMITGAAVRIPSAEVLRKPFELADLLGAVARHCPHASPPYATATRENRGGASPI